MDINELNKTQLVLLTLLITFVVSIATGIVTVSLMQKMPKSVPQTINNVIQRTIEKVTTVPAPTTDTKDTEGDNTISLSSNDALVPIYLSDTKIDTSATPTDPTTTNNSLGNGIIISDSGLILVDSNILTVDTKYKVLLDKSEFELTILKKFDNGFTVLKINPKQDSTSTESGNSSSAAVDSTQ